MKNNYVFSKHSERMLLTYVASCKNNDTGHISQIFTDTIFNLFSSWLGFFNHGENIISEYNPGRDCVSLKNIFTDAD